MEAQGAILPHLCASACWVSQPLQP